jgi:predicted dithiol-disulfide oxidoreductase (DUF899 family)
MASDSPAPMLHARRFPDFLWPMWAILDNTPGGRGDFFPQLTYD